MVLGELFAAQTSIKQTMNPSNNAKSSNACYKISELLDNEMYLDDVCDALCIAIAELPNTLSLIEVVETLLYFKEGHRLICRLVANFPESFHEVCQALLHNGEKQEDDSFIGKRRVEIIRFLCKMNPSHALLIRSEALEAFRMPALSILLTLDSLSISDRESDEYAIQKISDLVSFISGIFFGNDEKLRNWFVQYVRNCQKKVDQGGKSSFMPLRNELLNCVKFILKKNQENDGNLANYLVEASSILRLYSALKGISGMKLTDEESSVLISLIICHPSSTPAGIKFSSMGLCLLLACPSIMGNPESEKKIIDWLNWLVREESLFGQVSGVRSSFGEMLLLIAIHFHGNQISAISELVSTSLGLKITLRSNALARLKTIFTQEVFTDRMITAHAVKVPVTVNLNSGIQGFLPVHCIYQLLRSRAFTRHKVCMFTLYLYAYLIDFFSLKVPIQDWIYKQVKSCTAPLNPVMPPLIEAYVNSVIIPPTKMSNVNTNEPITEEELLAIFKHKIYSVDENVDNDDNDKDDDDDDDDQESKCDTKMEIDSEINPSCMLTTQIILLYYILFYEDVRLNEMKFIVFQHNRTVKKYSQNLFSQLPIFYLVQKAKNDPQNYGVIFPRLLRLVATHYPHLCLVQDWLAAEQRDATIKVKMKKPIADIKERLQKSFQMVHSNPNILIKTIETALNLPNNYLWPLASTFITNLPILLDDRIPSEVLEKAKKLWWQLNCIFPDNLCVMTVNALSCKKSEEKVFTWEDIVLYPLHVLRCDKRVFKCPELMEITLHVIQCFLMASRVYFAHHLQEKPSRAAEEEKEREDLRFALITAQESSAIQVLLECCHLMEGEKDEEAEETCENEKFSRIKKLIAVHLHQVFIADPNLAKLVHFQGYSSKLLPFTVSSIPSMHICLDYIPELLSQSDMEEQVRIKLRK